MQVFRLMGMPDKVIAFDELPEDLLAGIEMLPATGFPRHWKEWLGKMKRKISIPPERDSYTGQMRKFDPIYEEDSYFYLIDWNHQPSVEKWENIENYVRQKVKNDFRLKEKLEDMARPLANNKTDGVTLEPEEVIVIPVEKAILTPEKAKEVFVFKCEEKGCVAEFDTKQGLRLHVIKKHQKNAVPAG